MNPKDWPDETRIDIIGANGPSGEHYDIAHTKGPGVHERDERLAKIPRGGWRDHWCRTLKERGIDVPEYCKECNSSDQSR